MFSCEEKTSDIVYQGDNYCYHFFNREFFKEDSAQFRTIVPRQIINYR